MKRLLLSLPIFLALAAAARAELERAIDATCRITAADGGRGTGCVFERSQGHVFLLTNAHVASSSTVQCEFWRDGHRSRPLAGQVVQRDERIDAAIVRVAASQFAGMLPQAVPIAPRGSRLTPGMTITSVGCAEGRWSTGWKGHVLADDGREVRFVPPPANGRSGSALFDATGRHVVGLIKARTMDDSTGIAVSVGALYDALGSTSASTESCPSGNCSPRLLPFRRDQQPPPAANPWPTLPPAGASRGELDSIENRLDRIALLIEQMERERDQSTPVPPRPRDDDDPSLRQRIADRLSGTAGFTSGKLIATALGLSAPLSLAIGIGLWLVARRIGHKLESGEPLVIEKLVDRVDRRIDGLRDRLEDRFGRGEKKDST